jgi:hypothetical protein
MISALRAGLVVLALLAGALPAGRDEPYPARPVAYQDADEFKTWWDCDAAILADVVKKIGRVEAK